MSVKITNNEVIKIRTLEELKELALKMNYTLEELMYEMLCDSDDDLKQKDKEIDRLNKIINKLEKDLNYRINILKKCGYNLLSTREQDLWLSGCYEEDKLILNKLKKLMEEGK